MGADGSGVKNIPGRKRSDLRKLALAELPWKRMTVSQEWIAEKLSLPSAARGSCQLLRFKRIKTRSKLSAKCGAFSRVPGIRRCEDHLASFAHWPPFPTHRKTAANTILAKRLGKLRSWQMKTAVNSPHSADYRRFAGPSSFQPFSFQHFNFTKPPRFPALRSGPMAVSGASRRKQFPSSEEEGIHSRAGPLCAGKNRCSRPVVDPLLPLIASA
jgi:hypothetical protein